MYKKSIFAIMALLAPHFVNADAQHDLLDEERRQTEIVHERQRDDAREEDRVRAREREDLRQDQLRQDQLRRQNQIDEQNRNRNR